MSMGYILQEPSTDLASSAWKVYVITALLRSGSADCTAGGECCAAWRPAYTAILGACGVHQQQRSALTQLLAQLPAQSLSNRAVHRPGRWRGRAAERIGIGSDLIM